MRRTVRNTIGSLLATSAIVGGMIAAAPGASAATNLTAATFNVCKGGADGTPAACAQPAPSWSIRRDRVANVINATKPDVVGLQEATLHSTPNGAKTQQDDIKNLLAPSGYSQPTFEENGTTNDCKRPRDAAGQLAGPNPCVNTAMLMYNTATVKQDGPAGVTMSSNIASGLDSDSAPRAVAWAFLEKDGADFLAISMHVSTIKAPAQEASRVALGSALSGWANTKIAEAGKPSSTPVVLMADLNSFDKRQPNGIQQVLRLSGWTDAATSPAKKNTQYSTINYSMEAKGDAQGFPAAPKMTKRSKGNPTAAATRIDYVFSKNATPTNYEVVVFTNGSGAFDPNFQASDHQMVKATLALQ